MVQLEFTSACCALIHLILTAAPYPLQHVSLLLGGDTLPASAMTLQTVILVGLNEKDCFLSVETLYFSEQPSQ